MDSNLADNGGPVPTHALTFSGGFVDMGTQFLAYDAEVLADSPSAYYRFEEANTGVGQLALDSSGNSRHATYVGDPTATEAGFLPGSGTAVGLDGTDDYINAPLLPMTASFSAEVWARSDSSTWNNFARLAGTGVVPNGFRILGSQGSRTIFVEAYNSAGNDAVANLIVNPQDIEDWHHYAATYDGSTLRFFIDGVVVAESVGSGTRSSSNATVQLGKDSGRYLDGAVDEFALYPTALSPADIARHFQASSMARDQRGYSRVTDGNNDGTVTIDRGAVERTVYTVDTALDTVDALPGDGLAKDSSGNTSLRAAIMENNARFGGANIEFSTSLNSSPINMTIAGTGENAAATGDLDITQDVTILGNGADQTIIDAQQIDRIFDIDGDATEVTIEDVQLTGGDDGGSNGGGAINVDAQSLTIRRSLLTANSGRDGGAIDADGGIVTLTIEDSTFSNNSATNSAGAIQSDHILNVSNSTFVGNTTDGSGGAIRHSGDAATIQNSTIVGNRADADETSTISGGGIVPTSSTILVNTIVAEIDRGRLALMPKTTSVTRSAVPARIT